MLSSLWNTTKPKVPSVVLREGWLNKQSRHWKEWRKRWVVLTDKCLYTFKVENDYNNPSEMIILSECTTVESGDFIDKKNTFKLVTPTQTFWFDADSVGEKEQWIGSLGRQMVRPSMLID
eukprot:GHVR01006878.1.p1 GENE.GHVR01006878.1~~GHVR01006878.1.p1  ORF type:complete len:120 (+),score=22.08 GHVR01006878.1:222-581(+)